MPTTKAISTIERVRSKLTAWVLSLNRCEVLEANSGRSLDDLLPRTPVDVVVLDPNLPGKNGLEIAERVRRYSPSLGIIMLTARSVSPERVLIRSVWGTGYQLSFAVKEESLDKTKPIVRPRPAPSRPD